MNRLKTYLLTLITMSVLVTSPRLSAEDYDIRVLAKKPLPRSLFTQGLEFDGNDLLISSGLYKVSKLTRMDFSSMQATQERALDASHFAEGLTVLGERIYQLTWKNRLLLVRDRQSLVEVDRWTIPGEGWGLTNNGKDLIYSNGSHRLTFVDPSSGSTLRTLDVTFNGRTVSRLNELEWIDGEIWANIWGSNHIVIIDPASGIVSGRANLNGLLPRQDRRRDTDVLNGIAKHPGTGAIWVTGKRWPWLYQIELIQNEAETGEVKTGEIDTDRAVKIEAATPPPGQVSR
jgi:glutaminyl-peptide cyclotransferase